MKASQCTFLSFWFLLYRVAAADDVSSAVCSVDTFRVVDFPVGSPWMVLRENVVDPMPLRVTGFSDYAQATTIWSELECTPRYDSSFKISGVTVTKGITDYEQDGLDRATTKVFRNVRANGVWYVSIDTSGPAMCTWILKVKGCYEDNTQDGSGDGNNQNNNNQNGGDENDNSALGEEQTTSPSATPSYIPSDVPSLSPSLAPSDTQSSYPSDVPSGFPSSSLSDVPSSQPSDVPSLFLSSSLSDVPSMIPTVSPTTATLSDVPSLVPLTTSDIPSSIPSMEATSTELSLHSEQTQWPTLALEDTDSDNPSLTPSLASISDAPSDLPSDVPSAAQSLEPSVSKEGIDSQRPTLALVDTESDTPSLMPSRASISDAPSDLLSDVPSAASMPQSLEPSVSKADTDSQPSQQSSEQPAAGPTPYLFDDDIVAGIAEASMAVTGFSSVACATSLFIGALLGGILS